MARPVTYVDRIDTKVRIRRDHQEAIQERIDRGDFSSRNQAIEFALDALLGTKRPKAPRLVKADPAQALGKPAASTAGTRKAPKVLKVGEEISKAAAAADETPLITTTPPRTPRSPRRPYR